MSASLEPTVEEGRAQQARLGYRPYNGPKLEGPRAEIAVDDDRYPPSLGFVRNPPSTLYCIGDPAALAEGLAVVGARRATPYGRACAEKFASIAAQHGIAIISGGARGCDGVAHRAALACGTPTVAILGGGCDQIYPASHYRLFQQIVDAGGVVVSEREWSFPALPYTFRERNRLIAGLARAVLIVEAGLPSGTFSTADEALAANRDVLVVPGAITSPTSAGSNQLMHQGAYPVVSGEAFEDALSRIFPIAEQEAPSGTGDPYARFTDVPERRRDVLLEALLADPMRMDDILRTVPPLLPHEEEPVAHINVHLAELERDKLIARYPDGRYGPCKA
ncbi:DNA-processing protein DprA [Curtanaerobium respiraculi]|uniref:DNA-processing protein DprA n=1 Tax=Curtanaerobium respiraculi TaxID=2949669 RepID=UPI0024B3A662|nr:DNA-processing protein DprA [Curtanaerobium respiraculi]